MSEPDKRPAPRPRKHAVLWQAYLTWSEEVERRKRHTLRISAIEAKKSNLDLQFEIDALEKLGCDAHIEYYKGIMIDNGAATGHLWDWITAIKGLGAGSLAAQLIALIDDIERAPTISALWRYAGYAVIDGKAEKNRRGERSHFNGRLKSVCWLISDQFIRHQTDFYRDIYDEYKYEQRQKHPEVVIKEKEVKQSDGTIKITKTKHFTDGHLHARARRYMMKMFLSHLWVTWRKHEGLPISDPYVKAILGHSQIIEP